MKFLYFLIALTLERLNGAGFDLFDKPSAPDPENPRHSKYMKEPLNILNEEDFDVVLFEFKFVVILFLPDHVNYKKEEEVFNEIAIDLKNDTKIIICGIYFGGIETHNFMYLNAGIKEPSLIFFEKTRKRYFGGSFTDKKAISEWIFYQSERKIFNITNSKEFHNFYNIPNKTKILAVYYEHMQYEIMTLERMVMQDIFSDSGNFVVGLALDQSIIPIPSNLEQPSVVLYKEFIEKGDTPISIFRGNFSNGHKIMDFCNTESLPLVTEYSEDTAYRLFGGPIPNQIILLLDPAKDNTKVENEFRKAALENKKNVTKWILFVKAYVGSKENEHFIDQFGVTKLESLPQIFLSEIDNTLASLTKYEYIKDVIKKEFVLDFIDEYLEKRLPIHYKSDDLPDNSERKMRILVGKNYMNEVINSDENYCVLYCSEKVPIYCQNAMKIFEFVANMLPVEKAHKIKFGFFELAKNEVPSLVVNDVPHIRMYRKGEKKKFKEFNMEFTIKNLLTFVNYYIAGLRFKINDDDLTNFVFENMPEEDKKNMEKAKAEQEEQQLKGKIYEEIDFSKMDERVKKNSFADFQGADVGSFDKIEVSDNYRGPKPPNSEL